MFVPYTKSHDTSGSCCGLELAGDLAETRRCRGSRAGTAMRSASAAPSPPSWPRGSCRASASRARGRASAPCSTGRASRCARPRSRRAAVARACRARCRWMALRTVRSMWRLNGIAELVGLRLVGALVADADALELVAPMRSWASLSKRSDRAFWPMRADAPGRQLVAAFRCSIRPASSSILRQLAPGARGSEPRRRRAGRGPRRGRPRPGHRVTWPSAAGSRAGRCRRAGP